jgi:hypothetical protein
MNFVNMWDANLTHDGFTGFAQRKYPVSIDGLWSMDTRTIADGFCRMAQLPPALQMLALLWILNHTLVHEVTTTILGFTNVSVTFYD